MLKSSNSHDQSGEATLGSDEQRSCDRLLYRLSFHTSNKVLSQLDLNQGPVWKEIDPKY